MAATEKKRKWANVLGIEEDLPHAFNLDVLSDDEQDQSDSEVDDEVDSFPGLDIRSDSEDKSEDEDEDKNGDEEADEEDVTEEEDEDGASSNEDEKLTVFPKPQTVISRITGQTKRLYPPIEPDYDTDSSTEDVRIYYDPSS